MINNLLGMIFAKRGNSDKAINLFEAAEKYYLDENITHLMGESYHNISKVYQENGEFKLALVYVGKAAQHKYDQKIWGGLEEIEFSRALLYYKLGRLDNALDAFKRSFDLNDQLHPLSLNQGWISLARGYMFLLQGNPQLAKIDFLNSLKIWESVGREDLIEYSTEAINLIS
jgi:tetratricopeptide (TPR) repeat protein